MFAPAMSRGIVVSADHDLNGMLSLVEGKEAFGENRNKIAGIKCSFMQLISGDTLPLERLNNLGLPTIVETQVGLDGSYFNALLKTLRQRQITGAITLGAGLFESQILDIAQRRDREAPDLTLLITALLPEVSINQFRQSSTLSLRGLIADRCVLAERIGNAMVYGAAVDARFRTDAVSYVGTGVSESGHGYGQKKRATTVEKAFELGADYVVVGSALGDDALTRGERLGKALCIAAQYA